MGASDKEVTPSRRRVLKTTAAISSGTVLADYGAATTTADGGGQSQEGVTFEFWDVLNVQSTAARKKLEEVVSRFEEERGITVETNFTGYGPAFDGKWLNAMQEGQQPTLYSGNPENTPQFLPGGFVEFTSDYLGEFSDEWRSGMEKSLNVQRQSANGWDNQVIEVPFGMAPRSGFLVRTDHFEEAGLDPDKRLPPEGYDDLIDMAKTLQKDGPADSGFEIYGARFDAINIPLMWAIAEAGNDALFLNEDWTDTIIDKNPVWLDTFQKYQEVFTKHGLSSGGTPNRSDEDSLTMIIEGKASITAPQYVGHPTLMDRAPKKMKNGTIRWVPMWEGASGVRAPWAFWTLGICTKRPDVSAEKWERKQAAAIEFVKVLTSKEFQTGLFDNFGLFPARTDVWDEVSPEGEEGHHAWDAARTMAEAKPAPWAEYYPGEKSIYFNDFPAVMQSVLKEQRTPQEGIDEMARILRENYLPNDQWE